MKVFKKLSVGNNTYMYNCIYMHGNDIFWKALYYYIGCKQSIILHVCVYIKLDVLLESDFDMLWCNIPILIASWLG